MPPPRALAIITAAPHFEWEGRLWSHTPYVREIDLWSHLFDRVVLVGPTEPGPPPGDCIPFESTRVQLRAVPATGGDHLRDKVRQLLLLPVLAWRIVRACATTDATHVRCPGNVGLIGILVAPMLTRRLVAKYAGQWNGFPGEKWTVRLQRAVLASRWWRGPVTVYGEWPGQPRHVVPFFTSVLSDEQIERARASRRPARSPGEIRLLYVGRLSGPKHVDALIRAVALLVRKGISVTASIVGDGAERTELERLARDEGVARLVHFVGAVGIDEVLAHYEQADTLVLISQSEGWPKAIAEAMTFGLVCVGSARGMVPQMLGDGRGIVVDPGDHIALAEALEVLALDPARADAMAERASTWGRRHSLEQLEAAIAALLREWWGEPVGRSTRRSVLHVTDSLAAGGAERMAVNLVNGLTRSRFRPSLCTTRRDGILAAEVAPDVKRIALERTTRIQDLRAVLRLARHLRRERVDVLHAHGTSLFISAAACVLAPRTVLVWHDHLGANIASRPGRRWLYKLGASRTAHVITVTRALEHWATTALGVPSDHVSTIPNFVVPTGEAVAPDLPGVPDHRVVCVANLRREKDHAGLVAALAEVVEQVPDAHGLLVGERSDPQVAAEVERLVARLGLDDAVTLLGARSDVGGILAGCAVGVLPSRSEGFPLALLEYGEHALPTVATDVGECANILDHGRAGRIVPPGQPHELAEAVIGLLRDEASATRLGQELHRQVQERFSPAVVLAGVEAVYDQVTGVTAPARGTARAASPPDQAPR